MKAIETCGLSRSFGAQTALSSLDLNIEAGEIVALLGPNGAGKTTTIRLLNGILVPDGGSARVLGLDPATQGDLVRARTGVLTEHAGLDDRLTTRENLQLTAGLRAMDAPRARSRIEELLGQFGILDLADVLTDGFSTGQRKRVALARALLDDPEVLFLDEPTSGLDPAATREVTDLIAMLAAERGRTIVLCTHVLAEAERLPARIVVLEHGAVLADGYRDSLTAELFVDVSVTIALATPDHADTALATANSLSCVRSAEAADDCLRLRVTERDAMPGVLRALIRDGVDICESRIEVPGLEQVYFEILRRSASSGSTLDIMPTDINPRTLVGIDS
jgi:ABC-2 type transport system ATP-binding protein